MKALLATLSVVFVILLGGFLIAHWYQGFTFTNQCAVHLDRAAHAPTLSVAKESLDKVVGYAKDHNLTSGNTGVVWRVPANDIGYWFTRLVECQKDLESAALQKSSLVESNVLMKLRETLTQGNHIPDGLAYAPNNVGWCIAGWVFGVLGIAGLATLTILIAVYADSH